MPTEIVPGSFRRFLLDIEEDEIFFKFDVHILEKEPEPWVEIYRIDDSDCDFVKVPVITAPASEVAELLEKILSFVKTAETSGDVEAMKNIGVDASQFL